MSDDIGSAILTYITGELLEEKAELGPDGPLLDGVLDSFGLMSLVSFIEEHFDVVVDVDEVTKDNFHDVSAIAAFVTNKRLAA